jgi:crotonobetainyl-CoA:carnitine CoA-transferase CaiB-like acyl-CoA transferase
MNATPTPGPLAGLKVIEICTTIAGPACTRLLADFGADVIKIEPPEGDPVRQMGQHVGPVSLYAASILRNKRSIALDLKTPQGRELAAELIARADILVENNRPGVMERLGLGYDDAVGTQPRPGDGAHQWLRPERPLRRAPRLRRDLRGRGRRAPHDRRPGSPAGPRGAGHHRLPVVGVRGLRCGHRDSRPHEDRQRPGGGRGAVRSGLHADGARRARFEKLGQVPMREGSNLPSMAPNSSYPTRDGGWVLIAANSQPTWRRLVAAMQQPWLLTDPRFETIQARGKPENMKAIDALIGEWTRGFDAEPLETLLRDGEVPTTRVYTIADIYADPHFQARDMLQQVPHPVLGHTTQTGVVPRLSATPGAIQHTGPDLGANTLDILQHDLGLAQDAIEPLLASGAVRLPNPARSTP